MCIPQRPYEKGARRDSPDIQGLVLFFQQDGSYMPVVAAVEGDCVALIFRDSPALCEAGFTITIRFEVNRSSGPQ